MGLKELKIISNDELNNDKYHISDIPYSEDIKSFSDRTKETIKNIFQDFPKMKD